VRAFGPPGSGAEARIRAVAALLPPTAAVGGWAAAWLLGVRVLDGELPDGSSRPVPVVLGRSGTLRRRAGVTPWRHVVPDAELVTTSGVRVTAPCRTAFDIACRDNVVEAVVAVDAMLRNGLVSPRALSAYVDEQPGALGVPQARRVVALADPAAESAQESRLRVRWIDAGFARPLVNPDLFGSTGQWLARVDLFEEEAAVVGEYDGAVHADAATRQADAFRQQRLERHNIVVVRFGPSTSSATLLGSRHASGRQAAWPRP
jgi:hypothetical protein